MVKISSSLFVKILLLLSFLGVISYLLYASHYRPVADDLEFYSLSQEYGILGGVQYMYLKWEGAYSAEFLNFLLIGLGVKYPLIFFIFSVGILLLSLCIFLKLLLSYFFSGITTSFSFLVSITLFNVLYLTSNSVGDIWFWFNGNNAYVLSLSIILIGIVINEKYELGRFNMFYIILGFILSGFRLNYSLVILFLVAVKMGFEFYSKARVKKRNIFFSVGLTLGVLVYAVAPGNYLRKEHFDISLTFPDVASYLYQNVISFSLDFISDAKYYLLFYLVLIPGFSLYKVENKLSRISPKQVVAFLFIIFILSYFLQMGVLYMAKGNNTPRTMFMIDVGFNVLLIILLGRLSLFMMNKLRSDYAKIVKYISISFFFVGVCFVLRRYVIDRDVIGYYSSAYDKRKKIIETERGNERERSLFVEEIGSSGWIKSKEIGCIDKPNSQNTNYKKFYNTNFEIYLKCD